MANSDEQPAGPIGPELLGRLLDRHAAAMELYARQWCRAPEDVIQQAFVQLARQRSVPEQVVTWLYRVVRNGAISAARAEERRRRHETVAAEHARSWFVPSEAPGLDGAAVIEALRFYAADHDGKLPDSLDDIKEVPLPVDPVTGKPFGYKLDDGKATLDAPPPRGETWEWLGARYEITIAK